MRRIKSILPISLSAVLVFYIAVQAHPATSPQAAGRKNDVIKVGDTVVITLADLVAPGDESARTVHVGADGKITLPLLEGLMADGRTCAQLEAVIGKAYRDAHIIQNVQVDVTLSEK